MTKPLRSKDGKFAGSVGSGKTKTPSATDATIETLKTLAAKRVSEASSRTQITNVMLAIEDSKPEKYAALETEIVNQKTILETYPEGSDKHRKAKIVLSLLEPRIQAADTYRDALAASTGTPHLLALHGVTKNV